MIPLYINISVKNQTLRKIDNTPIVADSRNYIKIKFTFTEEWTDPKKAIFKRDDICYHETLENDECYVPADLLTEGRFTVSVACDDLITADGLTLIIKKSGYCDGEPPIPPEPEKIYIQSPAADGSIPEIREQDGMFQYYADGVWKTVTGGSGGLSEVFHDDTLSGKGTSSDPLKVIGGGSGGVSQGYVDTQDAATLTSANTYTDTAAAQAVESANEYAEDVANTKLEREYAYDNVRNATGNIIYRGTPCFMNTSGDEVTIEISKLSDTGLALVNGFAVNDIPDGAVGEIVTHKKMSYNAASWATFDSLFLALNGGLTNVRSTGKINIPVGFVLKGGANGIIVLDKTASHDEFIAIYVDRSAEHVVISYALDMQNNRVTDMAAGIELHDAVNIEQLNTKAAQTQVTALDGRMTTAEGNISQSQADIVRLDASRLAHQNAIHVLNNMDTAQEEEITTLRNDSATHLEVSNAVAAEAALRISGDNTAMSEISRVEQKIDNVPVNYVYDTFDELMQEVGNADLFYPTYPYEPYDPIPAYPGDPVFIAKLKINDVFIIRDERIIYDYWWDGVHALEFESETDLSNYYNKAEVEGLDSATLTAARSYTDGIATGLQPKESGKGLSEKNYTSTEQVKLTDIAPFAQVNVIEAVKLNGTALPVTNKTVDITALQTDGDISNTKAIFTTATTRANILSGETIKIIFGKIAKFFADLKAVAFSGSYTDLSNQPVIPAAQIQTDWNQSATGLADYLKNKPVSMPSSDVPAWAKEPTKPAYTATEVGALATVEHDSTMTGLGTVADPLKVVGGGGGGITEVIHDTTLTGKGTSAEPLGAVSDMVWTMRTSAADNSWYDVTYGNGLFVAVAYTGAGDRVMTSPDGITWTMRTSAADNGWYGVTYGNGLFVAVSNTGTGDRVMTSPDGITWTLRTSAADNSWRSVTYGNGLFVAVAYTGAGDRVMTSPDGITWTMRTSAADNGWYGVTYGNGLFVAVSNTGTGDRVMTSPDGITWTLRTSAADNIWRSVTYGNGLFVAVASTGTGDRVMTSPDGITWTLRTSAADNSWRSVTYGNGLFVAVAYTGAGDRVMTSPDGITWALRTSAADNSWYGVTYGNGLFVAVAYTGTGTGDRVMTNGNFEADSIIHDSTIEGLGIYGDPYRVVGGGGGATVDVNPATITGAAGSNAAVANTGTTTNAIFQFTIPRGNTGTTGTTGAKGDTGAAGTSVNAIQAADQTTAVSLSTANPNNIYYWA